MKIVVTGGAGMLGREISRQFTNHKIIEADISVCDITDGAGFEAFLFSHKPDVVIHCAAMTAVDDCETNIDKAFKINGIGSANVANACRRLGIKLIAISTDYVFDGFLSRPYNEYDKPDPKTVYGKSKLAGEDAVRMFCPDHIILRISWLYGLGGPSFLHTMIKLGQGDRASLKVVDDQIGNPTSTIAVAAGIKKLVEMPHLNGTFHFSCEGECSWFDFASEIFRLKGIGMKLERCSTADFPRPAPRPHNSRLDKMNLRLHNLPPMPHWKDGLKEFLELEKF